MHPVLGAKISMSWLFVIALPDLRHAPHQSRCVVHSTPRAVSARLPTVAVAGLALCVILPSVVRLIGIIGVSMLAPHDVHHGRAAEVLAQRQRTLEAAWGGSSRTRRSGHPEAQPSPRRGPDQPTRHAEDRRNGSLNREAGCLQVVGRFRSTPPTAERGRAPPRRVALVREIVRIDVELPR